jgi:hypothetical protein
MLSRMPRGQAGRCCRANARACCTQDPRERFIADQSYWSEFIDEQHAKYEADTYFKVQGYAQFRLAPQPVCMRHSLFPAAMPTPASPHQERACHGQR